MNTSSIILADYPTQAPASEKKINVQAPAIKSSKYGSSHTAQKVGRWKTTQG